MANKLSTRVAAETCRTAGFAAIGASYTALGAPLANPSTTILIQNFTDAALWFSFDGVNDHFPISGESFLIFDIGSNKQLQNAFYLAEGETLYVKRLEVPTSGSVYFTSFYGR